MFDEIIQEFRGSLEAMTQRTMPWLEKADAGIPVCNATISRLKALVEKEDFEDIPEEINFFKNIKTYPMSYLIYFSEIRSCELRKPKVGNSFQVRFFEKELRKVNKFFHKNNDFVHYMEQGHSYMDHQFFTRNHRNNYPFTPVINYYQYPEFSASHDVLWAKVQAMYRMIHYIKDCIQHLQPGNKNLFPEKRHKVVVWSGSKTALVELIYALYANGTLNHGTADISTITSIFEEFFNIKLDHIYKTYSEIKARKEQKTKFLQELIIGLEGKMRKEDEHDR